MLLLIANIVIILLAQCFFGDCWSLTLRKPYGEAKKSRELRPKEEVQLQTYKCYEAYRSRVGPSLSTPFYTDMIFFLDRPILPRARYASTQQTSWSRNKKIRTQF